MNMNVHSHNFVTDHNVCYVEPTQNISGWQIVKVIPSQNITEVSSSVVFDGQRLKSDAKTKTNSSDPKALNVPGAVSRKADFPVLDTSHVKREPVIQKSLDNQPSQSQLETSIRPVETSVSKAKLNISSNKSGKRQMKGLSNVKKEDLDELMKTIVDVTNTTMQL